MIRNGLIPFFLLLSISGVFGGRLVRAETSSVSVTVYIPQCADSSDNDGDSKIDYPDDPGCSSALDNDETDPVVVVPPPVSSGGGGGGSYSAPASATVTLTGRAYPKSSVVLLKDAQVAATTIAGPDSLFSISLAGLSAGNYNFSVYSEDNKGIRSSLFTFPVSITSGAITTVSGIFIAPTISVDKEQVKFGDNLAIFGQSSPNSDITIQVNSDSEILQKIKTDANGIYLYNLDSSLLDYGQHTTKSKASIVGEISPFSSAIAFLVGDKTVLKPVESRRGDLNGDKRVNLIDFSMVAYWYKRTTPPQTADLNGDKKVDLIDFSILAFNWTG